MPVKKKGGKAKPKAAKSADDGAAAQPVDVLAEPPVQWITLSVRLVTWGYLNFTMRVPLSTRIFEVREQIVARHGGSVSASEVRIYKEDVSARNVIQNLMLTLEELDIGAGTTGASEDERNESVLFYDFKPMASECPLLLAEPPNYRFALEMKLAAEVEEEKRVREEQRQQMRSRSAQQR